MRIVTSWMPALSNIKKVLLISAFRGFDSNDIFLKKVGHSQPLFIYFRLFNTVDSKQVNKGSILILPMI